MTTMIPRSSLALLLAWLASNVSGGSDHDSAIRSGRLGVSPSADAAMIQMESESSTRYQADVAHRRLQSTGNNNKCPKDSIYHCNNPNLETDDDTVQCDPDTCRWVLGALDSAAPPKLCNGIAIDPTTVESLSDTLEPCLWWEMIYGDFQPTGVPTMVPAPSKSPSLSPTSPPPTLLPTILDVKTTEPTTLVTMEPTLEQASRNATKNNTISTQDDDDDDVSTDGKNSTSRPTPPKKPDSSQNQTNADDDDTLSEDDDNQIAKVEFDTFLLTLFTLNPKNANRIRRRNLLDITYDRSELLQLTQEHLATELSALLLLEQKITGNSMARIQGISLSVSGVQSDYKDSVWSIVEAIHGHVIFDKPVDQAQQEAVPGMIAQAMHGASLERFLKRLRAANDAVLKLTFQLIVNVPPAMQAGDIDDDAGYTTGGGDQQYNSDLESSMILPFEWNAFWISIIAVGGAGLLGCALAGCLLCRTCARRRMDEKNRNLIPSKTSQTGDEDSSDDNAAEKVITSPPSSFGAPRGSPLASTAVKKLVDVVDSDEDDDDQSRAGRYPMSEATSCYSYIEANSIIGDQSYSIAPSLMYATNLPGYDDDDVDEDQTVESRMWSIADGIAPDASVLLAGDLSFQAPPKPMDPRNQMVIFSDDNDDDDYDDDDLSMVSERAREQVNIVGLNGTTVGGNYGSTKERKQWSIHNAYSQDSDDQSSIVDQTRLPFASTLPLVEEASRASDADTSTTSSHDTSTKTPRARGANHDLDDSMVSTIAPIADYPAESSDDESSLFMGPGITSAVTLSVENKILSIPSVNAGSILTDKEKQNLCIASGRETVEADEDSEDELDDSFQLFFPTPYSPRKDMTQRTSGIAAEELMSMASF